MKYLWQLAQISTVLNFTGKQGEYNGMQKGNTRKFYHAAGYE